MDRELGMDNQILYKLGQIESRVAGIDDKFDAVVKRIEQQREEDKVETTREIAALKVEAAASLAALQIKVERNEKSIRVVEDWKQAWTTRSAWTLSIFGVVWFFLSEWVSSMLKGVHLG